MSRVRAHRRSLIPLVAVLLTGCLGSGGSQSVSSKGIEKINHLKDGAVTRKARRSTPSIRRTCLTPAALTHRRSCRTSPGQPSGIA